MAKAELVFIATADGVWTLSNPGGIGRWLKAGHALQSHPITAIWANPLDPTMLIASGATTSWRSTDGGQQWDQISMPPIHQFIASRTTPARIVAYDDALAYISPDAGMTWHILGNATQISAGGDTIWYGDTTTSQLSSDGGLTWQPTPIGQTISLSNDGTQRLTCTSNQQWIGDNGVIPTPPAGWQAATLLSGTPFALLGVAQQHLWSYHTTWQISAPAIIPRVIHATTYHPDRVWIGDDNGTVWYSENRGLDWQSIRTGFPPINAIASARLI
jgi:hypothetical protein